MNEIIHKIISLRLNALIVEDNPVNQMLLETILESWEASVTLAQNGAEALSMLTINVKHDKPFDVIFMDVEMPRMDGIEATRRIREAKIRTPIVGCTAHNGDDKIREYKSAGMDAFLFKPFASDAVLRVIDDVLLKAPSR